jgi:uncharacterized membrane protein
MESPRVHLRTPTSIGVAYGVLYWLVDLAVIFSLPPGTHTAMHLVMSLLRSLWLGGLVTLTVFAWRNRSFTPALIPLMIGVTGIFVMVCFLLGEAEWAARAVLRSRLVS